MIRQRKADAHSRFQAKAIAAHVHHRMVGCTASAAARALLMPPNAHTRTFSLCNDLQYNTFFQLHAQTLFPIVISSLFYSFDVQPKNPVVYFL